MCSTKTRTRVKFPTLSNLIPVMLITPICCFSLLVVRLVSALAQSSTASCLMGQMALTRDLATWASFNPTIAMASLRRFSATNASLYNMTRLSNSTFESSLRSNTTLSQNSTTTLKEYLTETRTATVPADACCFVVQDTVNVRYWARKQILFHRMKTCLRLSVHRLQHQNLFLHS